MPFFQKMLDGLIFVVLRRVARYRFQVIKKNLEASFNYRNAQDLKQDIREYYKFIARVFRQQFARPTRALIQRKVKFKASREVITWLETGKSVIVVMGHIGNWEWAAQSISYAFPGQVCGIYRKIKTKWMNQMMLRRRMLSTEYVIESGRLGEIIKLIKSRPFLFLMIADQNPGNDRGMLWTRFLNQDTAFANGPEAIALRYQLPVVYAKVMPAETDGYSVELEAITDGKNLQREGEITAAYAQLLEENIKSYRTGWLWSHRRWKRKRNPS